MILHPPHTHIHTHVLVGSPLMPVGAQLLPGSYSLCLLPGTLLHALRLPCSVLEQKSWMSSDGPADGVVFFSPLTLQPEREGFFSPRACLCLHVVKQSNFDKFLPTLAPLCCPLAAAGGAHPQSCSHMWRCADQYQPINVPL